MKMGIVGAGILGQLLAFRLVNLGYEITLFDKAAVANTESCSMAAAGLLSPVAELENGAIDLYKLGLSSLQLWPEIIKQLAEPVFFGHKGSLLLASPQDKLLLDHCIKKIGSKLSNNEPINALDKHRINQLEPELITFSHGYYFPAEGFIDNQGLLSALSNYLLAAKVKWMMNAEIVHIEPYLIKTAQSTAQFDWVFDCRGLGAKDRFSDLRGVRGELLWLYAPDVKISRPIRLFHPKYPVYIVPRPDSVYLVGASEIETEDSSEISVRTTLELLSSAYYLQAKFAEARIIKTVTHCRPALFNHKPKIKFTPGLIAINGLYRHGFLLSPALVDDVLRFLTHDFSAVNHTHFWEECDEHFI